LRSKDEEAAEVEEAFEKSSEANVDTNDPGSSKPYS